MPRTPLSALICALMIFWFLAVIFAPPYLAAWYYETAAPTRAQVELAKFILLLPFAVPLCAFLLWLWGHQRRDDKAMRRRVHFEAKFEDPSRELRLDRTRPHVD
jgi:hypothetical protein